MRKKGPPAARGAVPTRAPMGTIPRPVAVKAALKDDEKKALGTVLEGLIGTKGACLLDEKINVLGKVPLAELSSTLKSLSNGVYAVVLDGVVERELVDVAERGSVKHLVCMDTRVKPMESRVNIITAAEL